MKTFKIQNVNGMYWAGTCWTCALQNAETYTELGELPTEIDGLELEVHDPDTENLDCRYYAEGEMEAEASVRVTEL